MFAVRFFVTVLLFHCCITASAQQIQVLTQRPKVSLRGLSVVNDQIIWASGSQGSVARSTDGGKTFEWLTVKGFEQRDFRDIEAFDSHTAIIIAVAEPAIILKTKDGGKSWSKVFEDSTEGMFLDAMDFIGGNGVVIGDPIDGNAYIAVTKDSGDTWQHDPLQKNYLGLPMKIPLAKGEAFFASSGTNFKLLVWNKYGYSLVGASGGTHSSLFSESSIASTLPIIQGKESTGANSIAVYNNKQAVVVGGDFANDKDSSQNCVLLSLKTKVQYSFPKVSPHGYRSCVAYITGRKLITCGTSGVDISKDGGVNWSLISTESFHVCQKAKKGNRVFLAGKDGRIAMLLN